jgi:hypothetical protein
VIECFKAQQKELLDLRQAGTGSIPSGAVMAFDLPTGCPFGWSGFERGISRTIIGASNVHGSNVNNFDRSGQPLRAYPYQSDGGEEKHVLTIPEMPSHDHGILLQPIDDLNRTDKYPGFTNVGRDSTKKSETWIMRYSESSGGGQPHNVMPPFIALFYCRKN